MQPIKIANSKTSRLSFSMDISGVGEEAAPNARFVIVSEGMNLAFPCEQDDDSWCATIPPLPFLESGTYDCFVEVMVDSFYFRPFKSKCSLSGAPVLNVTQPKMQATGPVITVSETVIEEDKRDPEKSHTSAGTAAPGGLKGLPSKVVKNMITRSDVLPSFTDMIKDQVHDEQKKKKKAKLNKDLQDIASKV